MNTHFEMAAGSIPGREHVGNGRLLVGRNNQDACCFHSDANLTAAVICDGCGSSPHSEVGAQLVARLAVQSLRRHLDDLDMAAVEDVRQLSPNVVLERVRLDLLSQLRVLAMQLGGRLEQTLHDYFLCTLLGVVVLAEETWLFAIGDGVFLINGELIRLGPFPGNAPPYLAYALFDRALAAGENEALRLQLIRQLPTAAVDSVLLASDGLLDLLNSAERMMPGSDRPVGAIEQFLRDDRYFRNADAVRRKLALINSSAYRFDPITKRPTHQPGWLPDDTTLIVLRRRL